jgi:4-diphosphocytidyl-2-C-methyl-D-erythritol kinase
MASCREARNGVSWHIVKLLAPAKINLHLRVAPQARDGFHPLLSWMCTVGLFDTLVLERTAQTKTRPQTQLSCDDPSLPCDGSNLVVRAADAVSRRAVSRLAELGRAAGEGGLAIELQKRIPMGGGLGGGSSDAARVVLGLDRLCQLHLPIDQLSAICAGLGSDVAFFCYGPSSICSGRGQIVRPIDVPMPRWAVLILPPIAVPTGPVYKRFDQLLSEDDRRQLTEAVETEPNWQEWRSLRSQHLLAKLVNDLERPAFDLHPALARLRQELEQFVGRIVRMSGSGSSLFTLYDDASAAEDAAGKIIRRGDCRAIAVALAPRIEDDLAAN